MRDWGGRGGIFGEELGSGRGGDSGERCLESGLG